MRELSKRKYVLYQAFSWMAALLGLIRAFSIVDEVIAYLQQTEGEKRLAGLAMCSLTPLIWGAVLWLNKRYGHFDPPWYRPFCSPTLFCLHMAGCTRI